MEIKNREVITKRGLAVIREAKESDIKTVFRFICELAEYEKMTDEVTATEEILYNSLFEQRLAEVLLVEVDNVPVGFALYFHNFSTFKGKAGLYLEDLYIQPEFRGLGLGKALLSELAAIAIERGCERFEWVVLDWNSPSIDFYKSMGALPLDEWTIFRLSGAALRDGKLNMQ